MEFEQKAEEKKMSMSKNIARLAVTAGLTAALSFGGVMAPVTMAFAADAAAATTNSVTIKKNVKNGDVKYKAYQIFKADVVDKDGKRVASNVDWAKVRIEQFFEYLFPIGRFEFIQRHPAQLIETGPKAFDLLLHIGCLDRD